MAGIFLSETMCEHLRASVSRMGNLLQVRTGDDESTTVQRTAPALPGDVSFTGCNVVSNRAICMDNRRQMEALAGVIMMIVASKIASTKCI
jgi:hypothetical protein